MESMKVMEVVNKFVFMLCYIMCCLCSLLCNGMGAPDEQTLVNMTLINRQTTKMTIETQCIAIKNEFVA